MNSVGGKGSEHPQTSSVLQGFPRFLDDEVEVTRRHSRLGWGREAAANGESQGRRDVELHVAAATLVTSMAWC